MFGVVDVSRDVILAGCPYMHDSRYDNLMRLYISTSPRRRSLLLLGVSMLFFYIQRSIKQSRIHSDMS